MQSNTATRTYSANWNVRTENAYLMTLNYLVTVTLDRATDTYSATVDGEDATVERAAQIISNAQADGIVTLISSSESAQPTTISKRAAGALHADLGRLGYTHHAHYEVASAAVGRDLASLTELTEAETATVWAHACLVRGYSTPVTRYFSKAVAA